jgi:hypothetical protein
MAPPPHPGEPVSPELVLVDPELAARLRAHAVAGPSYEIPEPAPALRAPSAEPAAPAPAPVASTPTPPGRRWTSRLERGLTAAGVVAVVALLGSAFLPPRDAPRLASSPPSANAAISTQVTLAWRPAAGARYYLVEMFRDGALVHAQSTTATRLVTPEWLRPGRYTWRVLAGKGTPSQGDTVGPLESGWFRVLPA